MQTPLKLAEAAQHYLEQLEAQGKSQRTLYTYHRDLMQIQAFFGADRHIQELTLPWIGRFLKSNELLKLPNGKERALQTVHKTIRVFRMLMTWLYHAGHLTELLLPKSILLSKGSRNNSHFSF